MTPLTTTAPAIRTLADLLERLGGIAPGRVLCQPAPGRAAEADLLEVAMHDDRLYELVDGALVEKAVGLRESLLAIVIAASLREFVLPRNLGVVSGADGTMRLFPGLVRIPDVAFASWDRFAEGRIPLDPIPDLVPDLVVEVVSEGNTVAETDRKRREYFRAGVRLVWMIEPKDRTAAVFTSPEQSARLDEAQTLDGGAVLPGFALPLRDLFAELDREAPI
ncbi:MAG: Uma2 family endonuclease [Planctomycetaceae bacterium]|nr:Uma2 family endonuclease [Planctomycetaceae bacterium]